MSRKIYSIIPVTLFAILIAQQSLLNAEAIQQKQHHHHEQQLHPSLFVDTKYWIRDTEFGERDNWRYGTKPCTLLEKIQINEQSVVSMGNSMDALGGALESTIKDLVLAMNGMLLLEEDTLSDPVDYMFVQYLNESGDCVDSETNQRDSNGYIFEFQPDSDDMSWFNPENWASALNDEEINEWVPESHRIPCSEDVVVFGNRLYVTGPTVEANERSKTLGFKVNFKLSQWAGEDVHINNLRVAKLKIGDQAYNQREFEQLIKSDQYENILFEFNSSLGVLKADDGFAYPFHSLLSIDESSIQPDSSHDLCLDEAGCLCGNENTNVMKAICSFNYPLHSIEQPCYDPVSSIGYCNKICATVMTISMDPTRFSERFIANILNKMITNDEASGYFGENVFTGGRRTYDNKYEITFRHVPSENGGINSYETTLGREREFAQLVYQQLNNEATKSFYGIKSINMKFSINWRKDNRNSVFWISFTMLLLVTASTFIYQEGYYEKVDSDNITHSRCLLQAAEGFFNTLRRIKVKRNLNETESFVRYTESVGIDDSNQIYGSSSEIPLVSLDTTINRSETTISTNYNDSN